MYCCFYYRTNNFSITSIVGYVLVVGFRAAFKQSVWGIV